jgi:glutamyl-tRNA synthetase
LYNYLLARQTGGQFILRIEDTDQKRYDPDSERELMESLRWLGLEWDEGVDIGGPHAPYRQSERKQLYQRYARQLINNGQAYACFCTTQRLAQLRAEQQRRKEAPRYDGLCRALSRPEAQDRIEAGEAHVVRFMMPREGSITVLDRLRGEITFENNTLDDYILVKSDGLALYHLAVVIDDHLMGITHAMRSSEWLPTLPLHAHLYRAFGWAEPEWLHLSVFLKPSGKGKMSKREAANLKGSGYSIFIKDLQGMGYLPEAVVNWVALMGWSYDDHTEFFTMEDLIEKFDPARLNPAPAAINFSKFDHFNGLHIRSLEPADLAARLEPFYAAAGYTVDRSGLEMIVPFIQQRLVTLEEAPGLTAFLFEEPVFPAAEELIGKNMSSEQSRQAAARSFELLSALPDIAPETAEAPMRALADELGLKAGQLFGVLRVAVTGKKVSPPLFESMALLGKATTLDRIQRAVATLDGWSE